MTRFGFRDHDHSICIDHTMAEAEKFCAANQLNLTKVRRRSLEILLREHRAMGAYDLLTHLSDEGLGSQPPVAYRALDFLVKAGFAHKIEALNAYVACSHLGAEHAPAFLICRGCSAIEEADTNVASGRLGDAARRAGFQIERTVIEAQGLCPACQEEAA